MNERFTATIYFKNRRSKEYISSYLNNNKYNNDYEMNAMNVVSFVSLA